MERMTGSNFGHTGRHDRPQPPYIDEFTLLRWHLGVAVTVALQVKSELRLEIRAKPSKGSALATPRHFPSRWVDSSRQLNRAEQDQGTLALRSDRYCLPMALPLELAPAWHLKVAGTVRSFKAENGKGLCLVALDPMSRCIVGFVIWDGTFEGVKRLIQPLNRRPRDRQMAAASAAPDRASAHGRLPLAHGVKKVNRPSFRHRD